VMKFSTTTVDNGVRSGRCMQDGRGKIELCAVCQFLTGVQSK